jgi:hypothetical protein
MQQFDFGVVQGYKNCCNSMLFLRLNIIPLTYIIYKNMKYNQENTSGALTVAPRTSLYNEIA